MEFVGGAWRARDGNGSGSRLYCPEVKSALLALALASQATAELPVQFRGCERDSDCVLLSGPCGCPGGERVPAASRSVREPEVQSAMGFDGPVPCPAAVCQPVAPSLKPACLNRLCVGVPATRPLPGEKLSLEQAAQRGDVEAIRRHLRDGAAVDARDERFKMTPLMWAVREDRLDAARALLSAGADPKAKDGRDHSVLLHGVYNRRGNPAMLKVLLDAGAEPGEALLYTSDLEAARLLLDRGADPNMRTPYRTQTVLGQAAQFGQDDLVRLLLDRGAKIDLASPYTPLMQAAHHGKLGTVGVLLERGADINATTKDGTNALEHAAASDKPETVEFLLDRGARCGKGMQSILWEPGRSRVQRVCARAPKVKRKPLRKRER